ncbi:MAG: hybrid sensor histidine kinase/response regulator [Melioribacteraceae bacterium]|nr:hybrid sensor histidine kinase/response regulator [Melioribacteraceae bacterium]
MLKNSLLIVEDDPSVLKVLVEDLRELKDSINILTASNGKSGCEIALEYKPDLILMDWNMPEMSGIEALKVLKSGDETKNIPVVMVTSVTSSEHLAYAFENGAQDYIRKPIDKIELLARLRSLLALEEFKKIIRNQNESLRKQKRELEESNAAKDRFFSIIGHDLGTPFNALIGFSELLIEDYNDLSDEEKISYIKKMQNEANSAKKLLENLLQWSHSQTGKLEVTLERIDLFSFILSQISIRKSVADEKNINMYTTIENEVYVTADKNMLSTIFRNLLNNALLYTKPGGKIIVHAHEYDELVEVVVEDTGSGIPQEVISGLFDVGNKLAGNHKGSGHGLGLILCKEFINKMNGVIRVESEIDKGSKFIFTLPKSEYK